MIDEDYSDTLFSGAGGSQSVAKKSADGGSSRGKRAPATKEPETTTKKPRLKKVPKAVPNTTEDEEPKPRKRASSTENQPGQDNEPDPGPAWRTATSRRGLTGRTGRRLSRSRSGS